MSTFVEQKLIKSSGRHALVIGGSITGLLAARVLLNHFDRVTIVESDCLPEQPKLRQGVPQANHVHVLLTQGQQILEEMFPGFASELNAEGAATVDWINDWSVFGIWGWEPRFHSGLGGRACSRNLVEWLLRCRLTTYQNLKFLDKTQVTGLLTDTSQSKITGVQLYSRDEAGTSQPQPKELAADLVVDASGRKSAVPKWLSALGYQPPQKTVINSFLGYATRWYQRPENYHFDWQGVLVLPKPPNNGHAGAIFPVEGNRWVVTLMGIGRNYPPNDEAEFLAYARSLRNPIIYEAIKDAQPLSPIHSHRGTENRLYHYEKLSRLPDGLIVLGDAVCAFNPIYAQGMTTAALGSLTLDNCLCQQFQGGKSNLTGLTMRFQKRLAQVNSTSWMMATGEDLRWPTTEGGQLNTTSRLMQQYFDQVLLMSLDHPKLYKTYREIVHMVKPPKALFQLGILARVLGQTIPWSSRKTSRSMKFNSSI